MRGQILHDEVEGNVLGVGECKSRGGDGELERSDGCVKAWFVGLQVAPPLNRTVLPSAHIGV